MRNRLQGVNPVKYSNRVLLDNDLHVLATACNHNVPVEGVNLEDLIESYKNKARNEYRLPGMLEKQIMLTLIRKRKNLLYTLLPVLLKSP